MAVLFAFGSAFFAGITVILAKIGIENTDSNVATAIRTAVILVFSWLIVFFTKGYASEITQKSLIFLILSGLSTGLSWIFYFKALQTGDVNKVAPVDKSSLVLSIILSFVFLGETVSVYKVTGVILISAGTYMMIAKREGVEEAKGKIWLLYAVLSVIFASLTTILAKAGIEGVESNFGTAVRVTVILVMAWLLVFITGKQNEVRDISRKTLTFLVLSGISTGLSWLCYFRALQSGDVSVVAPIDKLSIVVTIIFSYAVFKEKLSGRAFAGLIGIIAGTLIMVI